MSEEEKEIGLDNIVNIEMGNIERSESGRRRAVSTFQGENESLVSISLKEGYKLGKDSTGKKLMIVKDTDESKKRKLAGIVTWLSKHYVVIGLVSGVSDNKLVDLEIEVPIEAIDSYRALTADMTKKYMI